MDKQSLLINDFNKKYDSRIKEVEDKLKDVQTAEREQTITVNDLHSQLLAEKFKVTTLQRQVEELREEATGNGSIQEQLDDLKDLVISKNEQQDAAFKDALFQINSIEAHGRRWAIRLLNLPAPVGNFETTQQSKELDIAFCREKLQVNDLFVKDIDWAHRVGSITDGKQIILV
jgi:hypothetical protein